MDIYKKPVFIKTYKTPRLAPHFESHCFIPKGATFVFSFSMLGLGLIVIYWGSNI